jgi:hypothetical protein
MYLYHGTSSSHLESIRKHGIQPRGFDSNGNWEHTVLSGEDRVYLTDVYAGYFALCASDGEPWLIAEVDVDKLDQSLLRPDEDAIAQIAHSAPSFNEVWGGKPVKEYTPEELTEFVRDNIDQWADEWQQMLQAIGNCSYKGVIPARAITRISIFDPKNNGEIALMAADPIISIMNYRLCANKYRALTRWLMGETVSSEELLQGDLLSDEDKGQVKAILATQQVEIITFGPEPKWHMVNSDFYLGVQAYLPGVPGGAYRKSRRQ